MKRLFITTSIIASLLACSKKRGVDSPIILVNIHYIDSVGNNLYSDGSGYVQDSARLYTLSNGVRTLVNTARPGVIPTFPWGWIPYSNDSAGYNITGLSIQTNFQLVNDSSTIIIQLKTGSKEDTLTTKYNSQGIAYAWYNGSLKIDPNTFGQYMTILRE